MNAVAPFPSLTGTKPRIIAAALINRREILLVRRPRGEHWLFPGTQVAERSDDDLIVLREGLARDFGIAGRHFVSSGRFPGLGVVEDGGSERELILEVYRSLEFQLGFDFNEGCYAKVGWFGSDNLPEPLTPVTRFALDYFVHAGLI